MADEIIQVFIVDKNVAWRDALFTLLDRQPDLEVVGSTSDLNSAFYRIQRLKPHIVLIDHLPSSEHEYALYSYLDHTIPKVCFID